MQVQLTVDYHPSGRRTLKKRTQNEMMFTDCSGPLLSNSDAGSFYRAVAAVLYKHHTAGDTVEYQDTHLDMTRKAVDDEIPEARRFGERLLKHGLTLERASALALRYVPEDPYKGEPEKAADAFFAAHGHKYR